MSDGFQALVFSAEASGEGANLVKTLHDWLATEGIIAKVASDCTLGKEDRSFAPGANFRRAIAEDDDLLLDLSVNGVEFSEGRLVEMAPDIYHASCDSCGHHCEVDDPFFAAISAWHSGNDRAEVACRVCGVGRPLVQWVIEPPLGLGDVVVKFWNWAPLSAAFLVRLREVAGYSFAIVSGKLETAAQPGARGERRTADPLFGTRRASRAGAPSAPALGGTDKPSPAAVQFSRLLEEPPAMDTELEKLEAEALKLEPGERAALAQRLLASLEEDTEIEEAWAQEVERRIAEVESGAVQLIPIEEALARVRAALK
jgi:putative addiction module component (TIGR02574 family)